jgi:hypothetical protein
LLRVAGKSNFAGTLEALFGFTSFTERNSEQELPKSANEMISINIFLFIVFKIKILESEFYAKTKGPCWRRLVLCGETNSIGSCSGGIKLWIGPYVSFWT